MIEVPGKLTVDLHPDGTVRLVLLPYEPTGHARPVKAENLDAAEVLFMTCGLSRERAAALRDEVNRNKVASVDSIVDGEIAAKFRHE